MKRYPYRLLAFSLTALVSFSCIDNNYDFKNGVNSQVTLCSDELTVPLGSIDTLKLGKLLEKAGFNSIKSEENGEIYGEQTQKGFTTSCLGIYYATTQGKSADFDPSDITMKVSDSFDAMSSFKVSYINQRILLNFSNPLSGPVSLSCSINAYDKDGKVVSTTGGKDLQCGAGNTSLAFALDSLGATIPAKIVISGIHVAISKDLAATLSEHVMENFIMSCSFRTGMYLSNQIGVKYTWVIDADLSLAKYKLHKLSLKLDMINSLPLNVDLKTFTLEEADGKKDTLSFSINPGFTGGSYEDPLHQQVEAVLSYGDKTIPDFKNISLGLNFNVSEAGIGHALNLNQYLLLQNVSATLTGGVTL